MRQTLDILNKIGETIAESFPGMPAYVVGGTVRDILTRRAAGDMDLAVGGDVRPVAEELSAVLGGTAFLMDQERDVWRVTVKDGIQTQVDISPLKGGIEADLAGRDFTVNAMAVELTGQRLSLTFGSSPGRIVENCGLPAGAIIDPYGGREDIDKGIVRALGRCAIEADPLRAMRAFRFAGQLGYRIDDTTLGFIRELGGGISAVSPERVRDELYAVVEGGGAAGSFRAMWEAGLLAGVLSEARAMDGVPQGEPHAYGLLEHSFKAMEYAEKIVAEPDRWFGARVAEVAGYLGTRMDGGLTARGLVKLCAFLHVVGKPSCLRHEEGRLRFIGHEESGAVLCEAVAARLKMSERASRALVSVTRGHMRPLHLTHGVPSRRAVFRYVRDMGEELPASLVVALADAMATRERPDIGATDVEGLVSGISEYYYGEYARTRVEPLVTGRDLIDVFELEPGPVFRELLEGVDEMRAEGVIRDRADALRFVRERLSG